MYRRNRQSGRQKSMTMFFQIQSKITLQISGMVAQCAGCNNFDIWAAFLVGMMGGIVFHLVHEGMLRLRHVAHVQLTRLVS